MRALPTGTVTFVFTDIEGSTSMLQRLGSESFRPVIVDHNRLIRQSFERGVEIRSEGDAFFFVFASSVDAVQAALTAQQALGAHPWPDGGAVRVRMGLHTGEGSLGGDDYVGLDVHRAARIAAAGHGGQVLVSRSTRDLADSVATDGVSFRDLGAHRFKDILEPERLYQLVAPGLVAEHPPVRSLDARPHNLPAQPSEFIGREGDVTAVTDLLDRARLLTLTGPGGTGKTRLAVHVAARVLHRYEGGVVFVPLEGVRSPDLVVPAIAERLGVQPDGDDLHPLIAERLTDAPTLVLLDNFEHVIGAAAEIGRLLGEVRDLTLLVTSQSLLRVRGEQTYAVPPLIGADGVRLFEASARAVDPGFAVTESNREAVLAIVAALDSIPLAIELAAARVRLFGLDELVARVARQLDLGGSGYRDMPERHRTLRAAIEWSYGLLEEREQEVIRHLAGFDGGFVLDGAEQAVREEVRDDAVEVVASLLDKSLLQRRVAKGEVRFTMLDSIRQFARQQLDLTGEAPAAARRRAMYFADVAGRAGPLLEGSAQAVWLERLTEEHHNLRSAVEHSLETVSPDLGLRIVGGVWRFFHRRGHLVEAVSWLRRLLDLPGSSLEARAIGLNGLAGLLYWQGNYQAALALYEELLELCDDLGDPARRADTLYGLSTTASFLGDLEAGARYAALAIAAYEEIGSPDGVRRVALARSLAIWMSGDLDAAALAWAEAEAGYAAMGDRAEQLQAQVAQATIAHQQGRTAEAIERLGRTLEGMVELGDVAGTIMVLDFIGAVLTVLDPAEGIVVAGAATALRDEQGGGLSPEGVRLPTARMAAGERLALDDLERLWAQGREHDLDGAVTRARAAVAAIATQVG